MVSNCFREGEYLLDEKLFLLLDVFCSGGSCSFHDANRAHFSFVDFILKQINLSDITIGTERDRTRITSTGET